MNISKEAIVGELVTQDYRAAQVFKNVGIDFCCNGNISLEAACVKNNISTDYVITSLNKIAGQKSDGGIDYNSWPLDLLADYIEKKHHRYVTEKIKEIIPYLDKITNVHGDRHPELSEVNKLFKESAGELAAHMKKEELILFPHIRKMVQAQQTGAKVEAHFGSVQNPIKMMMHEHDTEGERFRKIASLTDNYTVPADGCNTYRVTLALIKEFEDDLHLHIHLENNILFPKALKMEEAAG
ncbi:MAG: iron-sulfur cluster repair di-iron protein [Bacteroidetes bacterium]|nr:iron-sulfur cluster repair di-iron protein [Bacteroidota bacterium]